MDCDIHNYIEVRREGVWTFHDWEAATRTGRYEDGSPQRDYDLYFKDPLYLGRSYDLFAILANVRNGRGFAGVRLGAGFNPICEPKGLPEDVTPEVKHESDEWNGDGHSHSWHTLADLQAYDWSQTTEHQGWVDAENYTTWKEKGKPKEWCGSIGGSVIRHLSHADMEKAIAEKKTGHAYTLVFWTEQYRTSVPWFLETTIPALEKLGKPEDVRLVFWFDN